MAPETAAGRRTDRLLTPLLWILAPVALCAIALHILWGLLVAWLLFPVLPQAARDALVRWWARIVLVLLGIRVQLQVEEGALPVVGRHGGLFVLNHISWADVFVVCAVQPVRFVAKSEIAAWPVLGRFAGAVGTVFVERGRRHAVAHVNETVVHRLRQGQAIGIFPEGTTSDGTQLLRFHANMIQAALDAPAPVVPLGLAYHQDGRPCTAAAFIGDMTLAASLWTVLVTPRLAVRLHWLPSLEAGAGTRHELAHRAQAAIGAALGLDECDIGRAMPRAAPEPSLQSAPQGGR